ncbi:unnamed protein product [Protopolystoma xenopodis]|uniref:Uncharacterized protein n=1 Tax=Protopolystoma xenopodis TaxID=117903 RepID=A0A448X3D2_9PLAT|nr:unnamed protein product [Protopolystoma xenopodis]
MKVFVSINLQCCHSSRFTIPELGPVGDRSAWTVPAWLLAETGRRKPVFRMQTPVKHIRIISASQNRCQLSKGRLEATSAAEGEAIQDSLVKRALLPAPTSTSPSFARHFIAHSISSVSSSSFSSRLLTPPTAPSTRFDTDS